MGIAADAVAIHYCAVAGMEGYGDQPSGINQTRGSPAAPEAMKIGDLAPGWCRSASRRLVDGQRGDHAVAKAVEDEGDDLASHSDAGDLACSDGVAVVG